MDAASSRRVLTFLVIREVSRLKSGAGLFLASITFYSPKRQKLLPIGKRLLEFVKVTHAADKRRVRTG